MRHLVELHGGRVDAASRGTGNGATFTVWLPALADSIATGSEQLAAPVEEARRFADVPRLEGVRVLLVDDEADARELFKSILEDHDVEVTAVSSVGEALAVMDRWRPDVLVSDLGMPNENGYDLIHAVRRLGSGESRQIPALALSAYAGSEHTRLALAAGFELHLAKPVEPTALTRAIAWLAGRTGTP